MPRNGSNVYSAPAGTVATTLTPISSSKYNAFVDDLVTDANTPRPIVAGGTGASSLAGAQAALGIDLKTAFVPKSAGYTAVAGDSNAVHQCTATLTVDLTPAATLGNGWNLLLWASGGDITIDPNASETVNGVATVLVPNGNMALLVCTGTAFQAYGIPSVWSLISADAGATVGPILSLFRNSASPAAADAIGALYLDGRDSAGNKQTYATVEGRIDDPTSTTEDASILLRAVVAGVLTTLMTVRSTGTTIGSDTTINGTLTVTG